MKEAILMGILLVATMLIIASMIVRNIDMLLIGEVLFILAIVLILKYKPKRP